MGKQLAQVNTSVGHPDFLPAWGQLSLGNILGWALRLLFVGAGLFVLFHLLFGALEWIGSGGDKEKVGKAQKRITTAITGLVILFIVLGVVVLIEQVFGIGLGFTSPIIITKFGFTN